MDYNAFQEALCLSVRLLINQEQTLFTTYGEDLQEEGISHHLACKMGLVFKQFDVDCEYSRQPDGEKKQNSQGNVVRPDIIIHRRGVNDHNLAVIEVKWHKNKDSDDEKITTYRNLGYKFGVAVRFGNQGNVKHMRIFDFQHEKWHELIHETE